MSALFEAAAGFRTLGDLLPWAFSLDPPLEVVEVVVQDEFSHDLVARQREVFLVFDTT